MIYKITVTHVHGFEHCFEHSSQFETKTIVINEGHVNHHCQSYLAHQTHPHFVDHYHDYFDSFQ